jgi:glycosyltransferase involved in cell wall biosynthesis
LNAARREGKPCVIVPHESLTGYDVNRKGSLARIIAKRTLKRVYGRKCALFVFASTLEAAQSFPERSKARQVILPFPLFDDRNTPPPVPRDFPEPGFRIGFLGRLHPKKNVDILLKTLALLPDHFTLTIGGDGPPALRASLESLALDLRISNRVVWKGFVAADTKDDFFSEIDMLVMPSVFESFGIVAAEAMMRGVPVIVSPTTGAAEIITTNGGGVVVEAADASLAGALRSLDGDRPRMAVLSKEAIAVATGDLSFSHASTRLRDQFSELVAGRR